MKPYIGAHVGAAGGLENAFKNAAAIGADCIQIFGASPRQWRVRLPAPDEIKKFQEARRVSVIQSVFLHAAYLVNCASPDEDLRLKSIQNLSGHLRIVELLGADGLIFHLGSGKELPKKEALAAVAAAMKTVLKNVPGRTRLIMENSAGGGQKLGSAPEELALLRERVRSDRVVVCLDTAHALEAGNIAVYTPEAVHSFIDHWHKTVGLENVIVLHANDSKTAYDSHHDRHENIGRGHIGLDGFKNLALEKRFWNKPWILEVPGFDGRGPDKKNIDILRSCFT